jgi:hypothetical protein
MIYSHLFSPSFDKLGDKLASNIKFDIKNSEIYLQQDYIQHAIQL